MLGVRYWPHYWSAADSTLTCNLKYASYIIDPKFCVIKSQALEIYLPFYH